MVVRKLFAILSAFWIVFGLHYQDVTVTCKIYLLSDFVADQSDGNITTTITETRNRSVLSANKSNTMNVVVKEDRNFNSTLLTELKKNFTSKSPESKLKPGSKNEVSDTILTTPITEKPVTHKGEKFTTKSADDARNATHNRNASTGGWPLYLDGDDGKQSSDSHRQPTFSTTLSQYSGSNLVESSTFGNEIDKKPVTLKVEERITDYLIQSQSERTTIVPDEFPKIQAVPQAGTTEPIIPPPFVPLPYDYDDRVQDGITYEHKIDPLPAESPTSLIVKDTENNFIKLGSSNGFLFNVISGLVMLVIIVQVFYMIAKTWLVYTGRPEMLECCLCDVIYYAFAATVLFVWNFFKEGCMCLCRNSCPCFSRRDYKEKWNDIYRIDPRFKIVPPVKM